MSGEREALCAALSRVGDYGNAMEILQSVNHAELACEVSASSPCHMLSREANERMCLHSNRPGAAATARGAAQEVESPMRFHPNDGGRAASGFRGDAGDCVTRAIAIALDLPYREVYDDLAARQAELGKPRSARNGVPRKVYENYLLGDHGWRWFPTMHIGSGCTVHLREDELPTGRIIARLSKHLCAVIDGVIHDTHDPSRDGTRCVYGYFQFEDVR
jgi:hypothetical protein